MFGGGLIGGCFFLLFIAGADPGFQVRGPPQKNAPSGGRRENFWGISCEKSRFYAKKSYFFPILGGTRAGCAPPPLDPPLHSTVHTLVLWQLIYKM